MGVSVADPALQFGYTNGAAQYFLPVSEATYRQIALEDLERHWELYCGRLKRKPGMSIEHNRITSELHRTLWLQLERKQFDVRSNAGHDRISSQSYYAPALTTGGTDGSMRVTHRLHLNLGLLGARWVRSD